MSRVFGDTYVSGSDRRKMVPARGVDPADQTKKTPSKHPCFTSVLQSLIHNFDGRLIQTLEEVIESPIKAAVCPELTLREGLFVTDEVITYIQLEVNLTKHFPI